MLTADLQKKLKTKAQQLKPVVRLGNNGLTTAVNNEIDIALNAHELIKICLTGFNKTERNTMAKQICQQHQAELIQAIGQMIVIYRNIK